MSVRNVLRSVFPPIERPQLGVSMPDHVPFM
jgi:hypothetical protein